jgi:hypothetical protein
MREPTGGSNRLRWKPLAVPVAVLVVGVAASFLFVSKMRERKEFVSKVIGGYRYRCTLSPDWKPVQTLSIGSQDWPEQHTFTTSPSPVREWIAIHLLHQSPTTVLPSPRLAFNTTALQTTQEVVTKADPEETLRGERHFRIDGCPATVDRYESSNGVQIIRVTSLCVSTPGYSYMYSVVGYTIGGKTDLRYRDQLDPEMQAIIASFHVEKVTPTDGKREGIRP